MNTLTHIALAGTAKVASEPHNGTPVDGLFAALTGVERERALLLRAAADASYALAGQVAQQGTALPDAAPTERLNACSPTLAQMLDEMLHGQNNQVLPEALEMMARAHLRLPPPLLPLALNLGGSEDELRPAVRRVLGERGRWLSRFNPLWAWVERDDATADTSIPDTAETVWNEGAHPERMAMLRRVRSVDRALARLWVEAVWRQEKADVRHSMLEILRDDQSQDDEPFLEQALDDRAPTVRALAATMLGEIPASRLHQRMRERGDVLLHYTVAPQVGGLRGLLRSAVAAPGTLNVTLPERFDKTWVRDGLEQRPPRGLGQRAWWLTQMLGTVAPAHWSERFGGEPAALIRAAQASEWGLPVLEGWSRAAVKHRATAWALPLWNAWEHVDTKDSYYVAIRSDMLATLVPVLPEREIRDLAVRILKDREVNALVGTAIIQTLPRPWDTGFADLFLDAAHRNISDYRTPFSNQTLTIAATALPPASFARALRLFATTDEHTAAWYIRPFLATIQMRQRLHQESHP